MVARLHHTVDSGIRTALDWGTRAENVSGAALVLPTTPDIPTAAGHRAPMLPG